MIKGMPIIYPKGMLPFPWPILAPHEAQARKNYGGQSLERLAERGGLSVSELLAILEDRPWKGMRSVKAINELFKIINEATQKIGS